MADHDQNGIAASARGRGVTDLDEALPHSDCSSAVLSSASRLLWTAHADFESSDDGDDECEDVDGDGDASHALCQRAQSEKWLTQKSMGSAVFTTKPESASPSASFSASSSWSSSPSSSSS